MKPTPDALWKGELAPGPSCGVYNRRLESLSISADHKMEQLKAALRPTQQPLLKDYWDTADRYSRLLTEQAFIDGFCLAARLLSEALTDEA